MGLANIVVIVLAAGKGSRFGESYTKLLHPIFGKPLIYYPIQNLKNLNITNIFVVVSDAKVENEIRKFIDCQFVHQEKLTGTADAVKLAINGLNSFSLQPSLQPRRLQAKILLVLNGDDATLYSRETLNEFLKSHLDSKAQISMMTIQTARGMEVGRVIRDSNQQFSKIIEYKEYLKSGTKSNEINCGVYLINLDFAKENLPKIPKNPNGEYYLTDLLNIAKEAGSRINLFVLKDHSQWIGVNSKKDLKYAEKVIKMRNLVVQNKKSMAVHFLGIAGSGTSACAKIAQSEGFKVTGCDLNLGGEFFDALEDIQTFEGHSPNHLDGIDILALSPAISSLDPNNPEILEAKKRKIKVLTWQHFLGKYLTQNKFVIAICGTHGKSTTTAMVGKMLEDNGFDPTVLLGANTHFWDNNFKIGKSKYFVVEADEFNDNFMSLNPEITIITNIEFDHPEYFKNFESYQKSFQNFLHKTQTLIIANLSDENTKKALAEKPGIEESFFPPVIDFSKNLIDFPLKVSGIHNIYAAAAVFNLALNLEIAPEKIKQSLQSFPGISRRMEYLGEVNKAKVYSDFAHHPTAIKVATEQVKKTYPDKKIWIIYQPHMFSRTKALFNEFVKAFQNLDVARVSIIDIYPSREKDTGLIHAKDLVKAINKPNIKYNHSLEEIVESMKKNLSEKVVVVFMGAGDIDEKIRSKLKSQNSK